MSLARLAAFLLAAACTALDRDLWSNTWYNASGYLSTGVLTDHWVPMSQREALFYYTPFELCAISGTRTGCEYASEHVGDLGPCNAGNQAIVHQDKSCVQNSGLMLRYHTTKPWPASPNLVDVIKHMRMNSGSNTLILVGDSVTGQMLGDAHCSLLRAGLNVARESWRPTQDFKDGIKIVADNDTALPFFQVLFLEFGPGGKSEANTFFTENKLAAALRPRDTPGLNTTIKGDVTYILNYGLHFSPEFPRDNDNHDYEYIIETLISSFLKNIRHTDTLIWRETSAQHFNSVTGMFETSPSRFYKPPGANVTRVSSVSQQAKHAGLAAALMPRSADKSSFKDEVLTQDQLNPNFGFHCKAIANETMMHTQNWRNQVSKRVISTLDPNASRILIAPFFRLTASRFDLHPFEIADCTHFCGGPMVWAPLWEEVARLYHHSRKMMRGDAVATTH